MDDVVGECGVVPAGLGAYGNLGHGSRGSTCTPTRVDGLDKHGPAVPVGIGCTVGKVGSRHARRHKPPPPHPPPPKESSFQLLVLLLQLLPLPPRC